MFEGDLAQGCRGPDFLGDVDEAGCGDSAEPWSAPSHERLEPEDAAIAEVVFRLEPGSELVPLEAVADPHFQVEAVAQQVSIAVVKEDVPVSPCPLGGDQRGVGISQHRFGIFSLADRCNADRTGGDHRVPVEIEALPEFVDEARCEASQFVSLVLTGGEDCEFVTAEAACEVAVADARPETVGQSNQHCIASLVTEGVIDRLEAIDVHHDHGRASATYCGGELVVEPSPVGETSQLVVGGVVFERRLCGPLSRDVFDVNDRDGTGRVELDRRTADPQPPRMTFGLDRELVVAAIR